MTKTIRVRGDHHCTAHYGTHSTSRSVGQAPLPLARRPSTRVLDLFAGGGAIPSRRSVSADRDRRRADIWRT